MLSKHLTENEFKELKKKFHGINQFNKRLTLMLNYDETCISGLTAKHLKSEYLKKKTHKNPPTKVIITKNCINDLVILTGKMKKSITKGISTFLKTKYGLENLKTYSREAIQFGLAINTSTHQQKCKSEKFNEGLCEKNMNKDSESTHSEKILNLSINERKRKNNCNQSTPLKKKYTKLKIKKKIKKRNQKFIKKKFN
ncbi:hypothetical protein M0813_06150 [Anaeramoeba flamelloides]|uniref:Uncharacterized protein n=1 Tax=Anaeramoeba flamelloides TaxID=1746091 RepID=A0ABQ8XFB7_9EUKA|nr:hypothetical protein M0813_06150 [Anaeramoeba flamelloides]